jgi:hypothetical protein
MSNEQTTAPQTISGDQSKQLATAKPASFNWRFWSLAIPVLLVQLAIVYTAAGWADQVPASSGSDAQAVVAAAPERLPQAVAVPVPIDTLELAQ